MVSGIVAIVVFAAVSYVIGRLIQKIFIKAQQGAAHAFVAGSYAVLFLAYALQIVTVQTGRPFSFFCAGLAAGCGLLCLAGIVFVRGGLFSFARDRAAVSARSGQLVAMRSGLPFQGRSGQPVSARSGAAVSVRNGRPAPRAILFAGALLILFVLCVASIEIYEPYFGNDMTVETAAATLATGAVYRVNPATGAEFEYGMTALSKCNAMPQLYAALCAFSGAPVYVLVCRIVPVWGLFLNVCACGVLADTAGLRGEKKSMAGIFYLLLVLAGDYQADAYAFRLLHQGFSPYTVFFGTGGMVLLAAAAALGKRIAAHGKGGGRDA